MRASSPFMFHAERFGIWRIAIFGAALVGLGTMLRWALERDTALSAGGLAVLIVACLAVGLTAFSLARPRPMSLRFDGVQWWRLPPAAPGGSLQTQDARPCDVEVAIDLGGWLLLRVRTVLVSEHRRVAWLPVQRPGFAGSWHRLRCALYARPVGDPMDDPSGAGGLPS